MSEGDSKTFTYISLESDGRIRTDQVVSFMKVLVKQGFISSEGIGVFGWNANVKEVSISSDDRGIAIVARFVKDYEEGFPFFVPNTRGDRRVCEHSHIVRLRKQEKTTASGGKLGSLPAANDSKKVSFLVV